MYEWKVKQAIALLLLIGSRGDIENEHKELLFLMDNVELGGEFSITPIDLSNVAEICA